MSALVHVVVAGPTLKKLTPAPITSSNAFAPAGVVPSRGGPFASTIGNAFAPFTSTVPFASKLVEVAPAVATHSNDTPTANGQRSRLTDTTPRTYTLTQLLNRGPTKSSTDQTRGAFRLPCLRSTGSSELAGTRRMGVMSRVGLAGVLVALLIPVRRPDRVQVRR